MLRTALIVSTGCLCFSFACVSTNDDLLESTSGGRAGATAGGKGGTGGSRGGSTARGGSTHSAGAAGDDTGTGGEPPGSGGSENQAGSTTVEGGKTSLGGSTNGGVTSNEGGANNLGGATEDAGAGGEPSSGGSEPGSGGTANGGTTSAPSGGTTSQASGGAVNGGTTSTPTGGTPSAGSGGTPVDTSGLVVRYAFDEASGTTAQDATGHFSAANLAGGAAWSPGRGSGSAVELSAATAHVELPTGLFAGVEKATLATWVNVAAYNPWSRIFDINAGNTKFVFLASDRGPGAGEGPFFAIHTGVQAEDGNLGSTGDLPLGVWKHVAITVDNTTYTMFVDGYPVASAATNPRYPAEIEPSVAGWLGKSTFDVDAYFKGKLDDFRIYDKALTQPQIADLAWPDTDYTYLRLDETSGSALADSSDRNFDGTLINGGSFVPGRLGGAVQLTAASDQHISLPPRVIADCDDVTIALWAKLNAAPPYVRLVDIDGLQNGFIFFTPTAQVPDAQGTGSHPELRFNIYRTGQNPSDQMVSAAYPDGTVLAGGWHHFAVTLSGTMARLYFDGKEIGSNSMMTFKPSQIGIAASGAHAWIGRSTFFNADPELDGAVDEVRISCRAFTSDEIAQLAH